MAAQQPHGLAGRGGPAQAAGQVHTGDGLHRIRGKDGAIVAAPREGLPGALGQEGVEVHAPVLQAGHWKKYSRLGQTTGWSTWLTMYCMARSPGNRACWSASL